MGTPTHDVMTRLLALARVVSPVEHVSVTLRRSVDESLHTAWTSTDVARQLDELQYELRQGPCLDALQSGSVCHAVLADVERRWPDLLRKVEAYEVGCVLSTPLCSPAGLLGTLNMYSALSEPFSDASEAAARELAALASAIVALGEAPTAQHLADVATSRDTVVRAQGVLMAWQGCPPDEAFAILRRTSARDNRRLYDVAEELLASVQRAGN